MLRRTLRAYSFTAESEADRLKDEVRASSPSLLVQSIDSKTTSNEGFLEMIEAQTTKAASTGSLLAKRTEVDFLLRLAGTRQIDDAIGRVGAKQGRPFQLVVVGSEDDIEELESRVAAKWKRLPKTTLTSEELARIEKAALLNAERA